MQLFEAGEVCEANSTDTANQLLAEGWKLLAVVTTGGPNGHVPCYVLGRSANDIDVDAGPAPHSFS